MKRSISILALALSLFVSLVMTPSPLPFMTGGQASAISNDNGPYVRVSVHPEMSSPKARKPFALAIQQTIAPGWHTYWKNPGDSGAAPVHTWTLPDGWTVGSIQYPAPDKIPYGPLMNYGYTGQATLLQTLTPPSHYDGSPLTLTGRFDVLVCKDICIPETTTLHIPLGGNTVGRAGDQHRVTQAKRALPRTVQSKASIAQKDGYFQLTLQGMDQVAPQGIKSATLFPEAWGFVDNAAPVTSDYDPKTGRLTVSQKRGDGLLSKALNTDTHFTGLVRLTDIQGKIDDVRVASSFAAAPPSPSLSAPSSAEPTSETLSWAGALLFAFIGGVILNAMPCVFPVLSLKALSLVKLANASPTNARLSGIAYTAGIVCSFLVIAGGLVILQRAGHEIGWGFHLQSPTVTAALMALFVLVALNLLGVFEVTSRWSSAGQTMAAAPGVKGAFWTGCLATLVATPCTAPFMASAIGVALTQPPAVTLLIFTALGLGLAFPFLCLAFIPAMRRLMPKPGPWMKQVQALLAFPMLLAVVWLASVLAQQTRADGVIMALSSLVALGFAAWAWAQKSRGLRVCAVLAGLVCCVLITQVQRYTVDTHNHMPSSTLNPQSQAHPYTPDALEDILRSTDQPVFTEMTAAWCLICQVNKMTSIDVKATQTIWESKDVVHMIGDWTQKNPDITRYLHQFGRNGVPLYVVYPAPDAKGIRPSPTILPQLLTPGIIASAFSSDEVNVDKRR